MTAKPKAGPRPAGFPRPAEATLRQALETALRDAPAPCTALELSSLLGASEKRIVAELGHLAASLRARGLRLVVTPARCLACGHVFENRAAGRLSRPGKCPGCQSTRVVRPAFSLA